MGGFQCAIPFWDNDPAISLHIIFYIIQFIYPFSLLHSTGYSLLFGALQAAVITPPEHLISFFAQNTQFPVSSPLPPRP